MYFSLSLLAVPFRGKKQKKGKGIFFVFIPALCIAGKARAPPPQIIQLKLLRCEGKKGFALLSFFLGVKEWGGNGKGRVGDKLGLGEGFSLPPREGKREATFRKVGEFSWSERVGETAQEERKLLNFNAVKHSPL